MRTSDQKRALFEKVMDRMVAAHWLHRYTFTDGKGFHLTWTGAGDHRAVHLRAIAISFRLKDDDRTPVMFAEVCKGRRLPGFFWTPEKIGPAVAGFFKECLELLKISDPDELLALVHIVCGWTPDAGTPIMFELDD